MPSRKIVDDLVVLNLLRVAPQPMNKYQTERALEDLGVYHVTHRAVRETFQRLEGEGAIEVVRIERGRAPRTSAKFYSVTDLGIAKLDKGLLPLGQYAVDVDRARRTVEARWTKEEERAYFEMLIAYSWLVMRLGNLIPRALAQAKSSHAAEKLARTVSRILLPDLATLMRVCYRHRDVEVDNTPVCDYVAASSLGGEKSEESCRMWLARFAPSQIREYSGKLPEEIIAWAAILSKNEAQGRRELAKALQSFMPNQE